MTTERAIEVLTDLKKKGNSFGGLHLTLIDKQALDKAIEVMGAYIQIGNVKPYHRTIK